MDLLSPTTLFVFRTSGGYTHLMNIIIIIIIHYDYDRYSHARLPFPATFCLPCLALPYLTLPYLTLPYLPITRLLLQLPSRKGKSTKGQEEQQAATNNKNKKTMSQPAITTTTNATSQQHPYYPLNALIPHYRPNTTSVPNLLLIFFASCTLLLSLCYFFATTRIYAAAAASSLPLRQEEKSNESMTMRMKSRETGTGLSGGELSTLMWFVLSGTIHVVFEGYYVRFYEELAGKEGVLGEMWKEYAFSDSR